MIPLDYLVLRLSRRFLPNSLAEPLMTVRLGMRPGYETRDPAGAAQRYVDDLAEQGRELDKCSVFVLGYGGRYGLAAALLERGASEVHLNDPYARPKLRANARLAEQYPHYFRVLDGEIRPRSRLIKIHNKLVYEVALAMKGKFDLVISTSVLEHVKDPPSVISALAALTRKPSGLNLHYIDLRDHYFRRPFEMLCHSQANWNRFLNPPTNLNRWRLPQYLSAFEAAFGQVRYRILASDQKAFEQSKRRIRPEFLTGNELTDSSTFISVLAAFPHQPGRFEGDARSA